MKTKLTFLLAWLSVIMFTLQASGNTVHHCPPANLSVTLSEEGPAQLNWCHLPSAYCQIIHGFEIQVRINSNGGNSVVEFYTDNTSDPVSYPLEVNPGFSYSWRVRSVNFSKHSTWANGPSIGPAARFEPWPDEDNFDDALVYPNPVFNNSMYVHINSRQQSQESVTIINTLGLIVHQEILPTEIGSNYSDVNLSSLQTGVYIVRVTDGDKTRTVKIIKH